MGIRYYAYAFAPEHTEEALRDPRAFLSADPLADAWGMEPGAAVSVATFQQTSPAEDMLYLDKAWSGLQQLFGPSQAGEPARPGYRMFEGQVAMRGDFGWEPWIRCLAPDEIGAIARDLQSFNDEELEGRIRGDEVGAHDTDREIEYQRQFLDRARAFVEALEREGRGMVYMIG